MADDHADRSPGSHAGQIAAAVRMARPGESDEIATTVAFLRYRTPAPEDPRVPGRRGAPGAGRGWTRFPIAQLRSNPRPRGHRMLYDATVTCAFTAMTRSGRDRTTATCRAGSATARSRSSGDSTSKLRQSAAVPLPMWACPALCSLGYEGTRRSHGLTEASPNLSAGARGAALAELSMYPAGSH